MKIERKLSLARRINSSFYIRDIMDEISDDCFARINRQIEKEYPNLDQDEVANKINEYLEGWYDDSDSEADTKAQAKRMVVDCWRDYIDLNDLSDSNDDLEGETSDNSDDEFMNYCEAVAKGIVSDVVEGHMSISNLNDIKKYIQSFGSYYGGGENPKVIDGVRNQFQKIIFKDRSVKDWFDLYYPEMYYGSTTRKNAYNKFINVAYKLGKDYNLQSVMSFDEFCKIIQKAGTSSYHHRE